MAIAHQSMIVHHDNLSGGASSLLLVHAVHEGRMALSAPQATRYDARARLPDVMHACGRRPLLACILMAGSVQQDHFLSLSLQHSAAVHDLVAGLELQRLWVAKADEIHS